MRQMKRIRNTANFSKFKRVDRLQGAWIGYQMKCQGITHKDIAIKVGVRPVSVTQVIHGLRTSGRIQKAVAQELGYESWNQLMATFPIRRSA